MSKLLFWFIVMTALVLIAVELVPGTTPQIAPPDVPKMDIDDPFKDPKVKQEQKLVNYIMDGMEEHINSLDWFDWFDWDSKEMDSRIESLADILKKYGYTKKDYYIEIKAMGNPVTKEMGWIVEVSIFFKSNKDVMHTEMFTIMEIEIRKPL